MQVPVRVVVSKYGTCCRQCGYHLPLMAPLCAGAKEYKGMFVQVRAGLQKYTGMSVPARAAIEKYNIYR